MPAGTVSAPARSAATWPPQWPTGSLLSTAVRKKSSSMRSSVSSSSSPEPVLLAVLRGGGVKGSRPLEGWR